MPGASIGAPIQLTYPEYGARGGVVTGGVVGGLEAAEHSDGLRGTSLLSTLARLPKNC
jgi:hypothetical protein